MLMSDKRRLWIMGRLAKAIARIPFGLGYAVILFLRLARLGRMLIHPENPSGRLHGDHQVAEKTAQITIRPGSAATIECSRLETAHMELLGEAADEPENKSRAAFAARPPPLVALRLAGRLTSEAIERLKLTDEGFASLEAVNNRTKREFDLTFSKRLKGIIISARYLTPKSGAMFLGFGSITTAEGLCYPSCY